jgi:hypothetical protein
MDIKSEILKCQKSVVYFLSNHCKLQHPSAGILPFNPFKYQIKALNDFDTHRYNIVRKCRQCFAEDTLINTDNGYIKIKDCKKGQKILSFDIHKNQFVQSEVLELHEMGVSNTMLVQSDDGREWRCTRDHLFLTDDGYIEAQNLSYKDRLISMSSDGSVEYLDIARIWIDSKQRKVYDLEVPIYDNYLTNGVVVHNCGISQISGAYALHQAMFFPYQTILIVSKKDDDSKGFLQRNIYFLFDNLPEWMQTLWEPTKRNEHEIVFPNGSSIKSLTSSPNVLRSHSASLNIIDEAAFIPNMDTVWAAGFSCVTGDTLISTDNGLLRIASLVNSAEKWQDIDIQVNTDEHEYRADKLYLSGSAPIKKITTNLGIKINVTPNHRLRVIDNNGEYVWKYGADLSVGDHLVTRLGKHPELQEINQELYFAGMMYCKSVVHDGYISTKFNSQLQTDEFVKLCDSFLGEGNYVINKRQLKIKMSCFQHVVDKYDIPIGVPHTERTIGNNILSLGRSAYYHFVCGVLDSQSANGKRIGVIFDSQKIANDMQHILFDFGFPSAINITSSNCYRLIISDSEIGDKLTDYIYTTRDDLRLSAESGQSFSTDHPVLVGLFESECGIISKENPDSKIPIFGSYGRIRFNDIKELLQYNTGDINSYLVSNNLFVDTILSIEDGEEEVYDIQVPDKHCYVANSLINHNTLQHGGRVIVISTLNGMGDWYYNTLIGAENKTNDFNLIKINWYDMDWAIEYVDKGTNSKTRIAPCDNIRECVSREEIEKYGPYWSPWLEIQWRGLSDDGEAWKFDQEVLARVVSSGKTVLPAANLDVTEAGLKDPIKKASGIKQYVHPIKQEPISLSFDFDSERGEGLWFWHMPVKQCKEAPDGYTYIMSVDTMTFGNDYNAIEIFCLETAEQCAEMMFRCTPALLPAYIDMLGRFYNNALAVIERNNGGDGVIDLLRLEYMYPNLWRRIKIPDRVGPAPVLEPYGYFTTDVSKIAINKLLINLIGSENGVKIYSSRLQKQLNTYINKRDRNGRVTGKTGADHGCFDDLVMSTGLGLVGLTCNPDPTKTDILPFKIQFDINSAFDNEYIAEESEFDPNLIAPLGGYVNQDDNENFNRDIEQFTKDLWLNNRETKVVATKKYDI